MKKEFFAGKTVLVMGLGRFGGGVDVAQFAHGAGAKVVITDLASAQQLSDSIQKLEEFARLRLGPLASGEAYGGAGSPRRADIEFHLGSHDPADFEQADIIVANPAVPGDNEFLKLARRHNKFITSQISIFFQLCPAPIIGITGANGKSTTAALTAHLLKNTRDERRETRGDRRQKTEDRRQKTEDRRQRASIGHRASSIENVWLSGNIGNEPLLTVVDQIAPFDLVVLELSSFQLEQLAQVQKAPQVALLTNLTPNHLDRYGTFADYCAAKENIFKFQKPGGNSPAVSIFNSEDKVGAEWFEKYRESGIVDSESGELRIPNLPAVLSGQAGDEPRSTIRRAGRICIKFSTDDVSQEIRDSFKLPGRANLSNLAAALAVAKYFGVDDELIRNSLPEFKPLPHRLELVEQIPSSAGFDQARLRRGSAGFDHDRLSDYGSGLRRDERRGVCWYNDSKATTPQSAIAALEAFDRPTIIIAGGYDKELPFDELGQKIAENAKAAILIGQTAPKIASAIRNARYRESCIVNRDLSDDSQESNPEPRITNHEPRTTSRESRSTTIRNTRVEIVESLAEAVQLANRLAETGDVVLLSPACASYDMFDNFQQRGREFIRLVREIVNRES